MTGYVFDIDDTLYCREDLLWTAVNKTTGNALSDSVRNRFIRLFYKLSEEDLSLVEKGELTARESNIRRFKECFRSFGISDPEAFAIAALERYTDMQNHITLSDSLVRLLDHLSGTGCPLAVITNGEGSHQWKKYDMLGLERWIPKERMIISGEVGSTKPDSVIFSIARQRMAMAPEDLWMIGDSYGGDIEGASRCGWHTVWINRRHDPVTGVTPDLMFADECEMADYMLNQRQG